MGAVVRIYCLGLIAVVFGGCGREPEVLKPAAESWECELVQPGTTLVVSSDGSWSFVDYHTKAKHEGTWRRQGSTVELTAKGGSPTFYLRHRGRGRWDLAYSLPWDEERVSRMVARDVQANELLLKRVLGIGRAAD